LRERIRSGEVIICPPKIFLKILGDLEKFGIDDEAPRKAGSAGKPVRDVEPEWASRLYAEIGRAVQ
jgi:hypothetical protein